MSANYIIYALKFRLVVKSAHGRKHFNNNVISETVSFVTYVVFTIHDVSILQMFYNYNMYYKREDTTFYSFTVNMEINDIVALYARCIAYKTYSENF